MYETQTLTPDSKNTAGRCTAQHVVVVVVFAPEGGGSAGDGGECSPRSHNGNQGLHILDQGAVVTLWLGVHDHIKRTTGYTFKQ